MGHGITKNDQVVTVVSDKDGKQYAEPWHGLGVRFREQRLMTSRECIELAGLNWEVRKEPVHIYVDASQESASPSKRKMVETPDYFVTTRSDLSGPDRFLGVVGSYYHPFQNQEAFEFMDSIVQEGQAVYDTAGSLFGGKKVWLLVQLPDNVIVADDMVSKYLLLSHNHDGKGQIQVMFTPIRVVCNNTCTAAMEGAKNKIAIRHTVNASVKLQAAKNSIGIASSYFEKIGEAFGEMQKFDVKSAILEKYFKAVFPDPKEEDTNSAYVQNVRARLTNIFETSPAIVGTSAEGNLWGAYNAITEWVQHEKTIPLHGKSENEQRFDKIVLGSGGSVYKPLADAFGEALKLLKN